MTWFKVDDGWHAHPKVLDVSLAARGLWVTCGSYVAANDLDGKVPASFVRMHGGARYVSELVTAGLFETVEGGWLMHDYLVYNPSKAEVDAAQQERTEKARRAANARWGASSNATSNAPSIGNALLGDCSTDAPSRPVPKDPPTPLAGGACSKIDKPHEGCRGCGTNVRAIRAQKQRETERAKCPEHLLRLPCSSCAADAKAASRQSDQGATGT